MKKQTPEEIQQKRANKIAKTLSNLLGKDTKFVLVALQEVEDGANIDVLHNTHNKLELLGMLEYAKSQN